MTARSFWDDYGDALQGHVDRAKADLNAGLDVFLSGPYGIATIALVVFVLWRGLRSR